MPIDIFGRTVDAGARAQKVSQVYLDMKNFLKHDGSDAATASLDMAGNAIKNLPFPVEHADAVNREYVDTKINNLDGELKEYNDKIVSEKVNDAIKKCTIKNNASR